MRTHEPHLPSFTLVLTQPNYVARQPPPRVSLPRYHPYPRDSSSWRPREDFLMQTIDERIVLDEDPTPVDIYSHMPITHPEERVLTENLRQAMDGTADDPSTKTKKPMRFSSLVIDLAFSFVRRLGKLKLANKLKVQPGGEPEKIVRGGAGS